MVSALYKALRNRRAFLFLFFFPLVGAAQELPQKIQINGAAPSLYDNDLLSKEFHAGRREALRKLMGDSSLAVFFPSSIKNRSNDVDYVFHQDPDFYYLTGLNEEDAMLMVFKNEIRFDGFSANEILFVKSKDPQSERWTGKILGVDGVKKELGFQDVFPNDTFSEIRMDFLKFKNIYFLEQKKQNEGMLNKKFLARLSEQKAKADTYDIKEYMAKLREIKLKEELNLMRKAINATCDGIKEAMKALEPGMSEYDVEAIVEYVFKSKGAEDVGYPSIVGGGENSCILHYESNRKKLISTDMMVCDVGAEYHGYSADVTRTYPVSGKFSEEQKAIYNIVLEAQQSDVPSNFAFFALAFIAGLNVDKFMEKIEDIAEVTWGIKKSRIAKKDDTDG